jgi:hypothetical protein
LVYQAGVKAEHNNRFFTVGSGEFAGLDQPE